MEKLLLPCGITAETKNCAALKQAVGDVPRDRRSDAIRAFVAKNRPAIGNLLHGVFEIRTFEEAEKLSTMLGSHCPDPESASVGIWELLSNAIEHGNLAIDRKAKTQLIQSGEYWGELERRLALPPYHDRVVTVSFRRRKASLLVRVVDEGAGFDHARELAIAAGSQPNGRGLLMARAIAFSSLRFLGAGNIVEAVIRLP